VSLKLRPFQAHQDREILHQLRADIDLQHLLMAHPNPQAVVDVEVWVERRQSQGWLGVIDIENGTPIGFVQLSDWHRIDRYAWLGIAIHPRWQGRGWGRLAMEALAWQAKGELGLRKLLLQVRVDNVEAVHLYGSLGYRKVGTFQHHYYDGSCYHDVLVMELVFDSP
jgi:RimJ/RimL family protein N-acetyltransferase